ncbi:MAG: Nif3-like dinuclear metal center hexameric protein [Chloroflexi bacterium]|nr:Nif3-like dinuclear metal center hexameric protein [Chloroflexota bacterium]
MKCFDLVSYLDDYLHINEIDDYGPQGLQVETANDDINRIALAVDVSPQIIETAVTWQADMLLVHHGILWHSVERITGPLGERVRLIMQHGLNLYAAHLPLDAHPQVGNNAVLARMFGVDIAEWWCAPTGTPIGVIGPIAAEPSLDDLISQVEHKLAVQPTVLAHGPETVKKLAIVSGFGADKVAEAKALGADTFLTGETSHQNYWAAADYGLNVIFAGHYATETVGVKALGQHLAEKFNLTVEFFDFPTNM